MKKILFILALFLSSCADDFCGCYVITEVQTNTGEWVEVDRVPHEECGDNYQSYYEPGYIEYLECS